MLCLTPLRNLNYRCRKSDAHLSYGTKIRMNFAQKFRKKRQEDVAFWRPQQCVARVLRERKTGIANEHTKQVPTRQFHICKGFKPVLKY